MRKRHTERDTIVMGWPIGTHRSLSFAVVTPGLNKAEIIGGWGGGGVNQAYSRLSTTHGNITECKLDSMMYAGICVVI